MSIRKLGIILFGMLALSLISACGGGGGGNTSSEMMKNVPADDTSFSYWDVKTLGTNDPSLVIYTKFKDSDELVQLINNKSGTGAGIGALSRSDIDYVGRASSNGGSTITILTGKLDIVGIKSELDGREDYNPVVIQKVTIWTPEGIEHYKSIAIIGNALIMGEKEAISRCIDVIASALALSLNDDKDISPVVDRLPNGVLMQVYKAGIDSVETYTDLMAYGRSYVKDGEKELKLTAVYMFQDFSGTGIDTQNKITDYYTAKGFSNIKIERQDKTYLKVTAVISINDFANILTW